MVLECSADIVLEMSTGRVLLIDKFEKIKQSYSGSRIGFVNVRFSEIVAEQRYQMWVSHIVYRNAIDEPGLQFYGLSFYLKQFLPFTIKHLTHAG